MSTSEKAIDLLQVMPERELEAAYMYMRFIVSQLDSKAVTLENFSQEENELDKRRQGLQGLLSFAGTLPEDFDYKKELKEAREENPEKLLEVMANN